MRVVYKKSIVERIYDEKYYADSRSKTIEYIYLDKPEWEELVGYLSYNMYFPYPKRVVTHEPFRVEYVDRDTVKCNPIRYATEEIEFMGIKVRLEYK